MAADMDDAVIVSFKMPIWATFCNVVVSIAWCVLVYWAVRGYFLGLYEYGWMWLLAAIPVFGIPALVTHSQATAYQWMTWNIYRKLRQFN